MSKAKIYTTQYCGYCIRAKALLSEKNMPFEEIPVDGNHEMRAELMRITGSRTVPQIWINDHYVGGCMELMGLEANGQLDKMFADNH